ncbi:MAG TPA: HNH endonuclease signature motif containing protein [Candidatus Binatia bacterium]|nr:HNH endonuclease signature motif containing protein [Candidatus Binatia bacterium]
MQARNEERKIRAFERQHGVSEGFAWLPSPESFLEHVSEIDAALGKLEDADLFELDARLVALHRTRQRVDARLGSLLRKIVEAGFHQKLGFANAKLYARSRLGICGSKAAALIRADRDAGTSASLAQAYSQGTISWLAVTTLHPVIGGPHDSAWIEHASNLTLRRLADEVSWALDRRDDPRASHHQPPPGEDVDVLADTIARVSRVRVQMRAQEPTGGSDSLTSANAVIAIRMPADVAALLEDCLQLYRRPGDSRWRAFERVLSHAFLTWMALPRHRDPVFRRDNFSCQAPGCTRRAALHDHHIVFRSKLGSGNAGNRTALCVFHHQLGLHAGHIRAQGTASCGILWEYGCRGRSEPVLRFLGDRYLKR